MLTFFGTILILYLVWLLVKPLLLNYARRKYTQKVNDMFNQAFGQQTGYQRAPNPDSHFGGGQHRRRPYGKKKIFSREDGEYVEFEEVKVDFDSTARKPERKDPAYTPREPQISDADWEEI